ncbi:hypothetical protein F5J12DRAFT_794479 [Pisolithus orientalis]|uniref:uncharacterized protein n=1 Tax=Pisolithus orientalis TaxID=936130 RepID=UPI0022251865|nr:uncharacterized protein F5J12DRAFT_794479 [Pisolithus orientalis]KAI6035581.1 hypothetical protein F5J12DRAFT_794479 [Pisolithus orientalis]
MSSTELESASSVAPWIQSHLTALFQPTGAAENVKAEPSFDRIFSPDCDVRKNHQPQDFQTFKGEFASQAAGSLGVNVKWEQITSMNDDKPDNPTFVAGAFVVTRVMPFCIRASLAQRVVSVHFSAKVEPQGDDVNHDRRITSFYYTVVDRTPPIHFATPHGAKVEKQG